MNQENDRWLVGIIIDVSQSMSRNWENQNSDRRMTFEVIRDTINNELWKANLTPISQRKAIDVFCLGMGFCRKVTYAKTVIKNGKEIETKEQISIPEVNLVCDLLVLSQLIPSKITLSAIEAALNERWNNHANNVLATVRGDTDFRASQQLELQLQKDLYESAYKKLHRSLKYRLNQKLLNTKWANRSRLVNRFCKYLSSVTMYWTQKIERSSVAESHTFMHRIRDRAIAHFNQHKNEYNQLIQDLLRDFANRQIKTILELLTAGHRVEDVILTFDEQTANALAQKIYHHLSHEVKTKILHPTIYDFLELRKRVKKELRASLNKQSVEKLVEQSVQKYGWEILEPFVENVVHDLIQATFSDVANKMLLYWITLANRREVVSPLEEIQSILPDTSSKDIVSTDYIFGSTPVIEAINLATMRLLNKTYKNHKKLLLIISDGEFSIGTSEQNLKTPINISTNLLKGAGVSIVTLYVVNRNVFHRLMGQSYSDWPDGAKLMHQIASPISNSNKLRHLIGDPPKDTKWCVQINHSKYLETFFAQIMGNQLE